MIAATDDILTGFRSLWTAAGLPALVTGGLHDSRQIPAVLNPPYAVVAARSGDRQTMTGDSWLEGFTVMVWVHVLLNADRPAIARALANIDWTHRRYPADSGKVLHVRPLPIPADSSPLKSLSRDIAVIAAAWDILFQQTRPIGV